jgi:hypothetical protein
MLFATLDIKPRTESEVEPDVSEGSDMGTCTAGIASQQRTQQQSVGSSNNEQVQPVFFVLQRILPVMQAIVEKWYTDTHVMQVCCSLKLFRFIIIMIRGLKLLEDLVSLQIL